MSMIPAANTLPVTPTKRPTDDEIISALALCFRVHESKVIEWLLDMDLAEATDWMAGEFAA
jgi:hypothetical protein